VAAAAAAGLDVLAHRAGTPAARTAARLTAATAVLALARGSGVSWAGLGLCRAELGSGVRTGLAGGACAVAGVCAAAALPATRGFFLDERSAAAAVPGQFSAELARITFAAIPAEELTYRSALLGLMLEDGSRLGSAAWSSALFGLSHISPTLSTMRQTAVQHHLAGNWPRTAAFVTGNVAVTGIAGAAFAWLRLRSGSVVAPLLAHAALNDAALVAGRAVHRRNDEPAGADGVVRQPSRARARSRQASSRKADQLR